MLRRERLSRRRVDVEVVEPKTKISRRRRRIRPCRIRGARRGEAGPPSPRRPRPLAKPPVSVAAPRRTRGRARPAADRPPARRQTSWKTSRRRGRAPTPPRSRTRLGPRAMPRTARGSAARPRAPRVPGDAARTSIAPGASGPRNASRTVRSASPEASAAASAVGGYVGVGPEPFAIRGGRAAPGARRRSPRAAGTRGATRGAARGSGGREQRLSSRLSCSTQPRAFTPQPSRRPLGKSTSNRRHLPKSPRPPPGVRDPTAPPEPPERLPR